MTDATGDVVVDFIIDGVDDPAASLFGRTVGEILGHRVTELFPRAPDSGTWGALSRVLESGSSVHLSPPGVAGRRSEFLTGPARCHGGVVAPSGDCVWDHATRQSTAESQAPSPAPGDAAADFTFHVAATGLLRWVSGTVTELLGWSPGDLVGQPAVQFAHPQDRRAIITTVTAGSGPPGRISFPARFRSRYGVHRRLSVALQPTLDDQGQLTGWSGRATDSDSDGQAGQAQAAAAQTHRLLVENAGDVLLLIAADGTFGWVSPSVQAVFGWHPGALVGHPVSRFVHPEDLAAVTGSNQVGQSLAGVRLRCPDDSYTPMRARVRAVSSPSGTQVVITGLIGAESPAAGRDRAQAPDATHDPLTGLANRAVLFEKTTQALASGRRARRATGVLLLDLDHFKYVNDSLGHTAGDQLLRTVAARILDSVRAGDIVARHGGDGIAVLMPDLHNPFRATEIADRVVARCREPVHVGGSEVFATASVGIAVSFPDETPAKTAEDLLREAELAMYEAKGAGRDRVVPFNDNLRRTMDNRVRIEGDLRRALARDELALWYQPEIDLAHGGVRAAEALLRWHHPEGKVWSASRFIDVAEQTGLILPIGDWVVHQACAQAANWAHASLPNPVLVRFNLSGLQLREPGMLGCLDSAITATGADPRRLCAEITETVMLHDNPTVAANIAGISERGINLAIDDFGTGYASLTYLRRYPIGCLKIDRSFITNLTSNPYDHNLVAGVIALADRLGISATAEGVETTEQETALRAMGCTGAQGYLYAPAIPQDQLTTMLHARLVPDNLKTRVIKSDQYDPQLTGPTLNWPRTTAP